MIIRTMLIAVLGLAAVPAMGQQIIAEYFALLGPQDMRNSNGVRLTGFCQVLQQDRANYHRFGRADELDTWDPVFANREARAQISRICQVQPGFEYIPQSVLNGQPRYVWVRVYGSGGWPSAVLVTEGAG